MSERILERRELVISGNLWKAILLLAVPVAINNLIHALYNLIDTLFVANIGSIELAAIAFVGPLNNLIRAASDGLAIGGTSLIGREVGRKDYSKAKSISIQLISLAILIGVVITTISYAYSTQILMRAYATNNLLVIANTYFKFTVLSTPFIFINSSFVAVKRANGETLKAMYINFVAIIVKIITSYVMIFYFNMGVISLAISTMIGSILVSTYAFYDLFFKKTILSLSFKSFKFDKKILIPLLIIGLPIIIEKSTISYSFIVVNKYIINFGENVLAGYGITNKINSLLFSSVAGFGTGLATIISQNLGAEQAERARAGIKNTFVITISTAIIIISIILIYRYPIADFFARGNKDLLYHTVNAMGVYSISVIPWAVFQVVIGVFEGTGHTKMNLLISLARVYLFRIPLVIVLTKLSALQEYSIWYAMLFSNALTAVLALVLYLKNHKHLRLSGE